ncbi:MAG: hypothetical protein MI802_14835, partial [Desulfobacterales bacterium]|nr:hypothetical protein [Desulfobacterales bacterium]
RFDQQPAEVMHLIHACAEAYHCTRDRVWVRRARQLLNWFLGDNDTQSVLYDNKTGGCRDALHADGANLNQGAGATTSWLISLLCVNELLQELGVDSADGLDEDEPPEGETDVQIAEPQIELPDASGKPISS